MKFGTKIYIPDAQGAILPDGSKHNGIFECGDTGGAITGNHIDVFIGAVKGGNSEAMQVNPFSFIKSNSSKTFKAYVIKE
jgi:3D (Asp-Asp-Asp) domain-containing protein